MLNIIWAALAYQVAVIWANSVYHIKVEQITHKVQLRSGLQQNVYVCFGYCAVNSCFRMWDTFTYGLSAALAVLTVSSTVVLHVSLPCSGGVSCRCRTKVQCSMLFTFSESRRFCKLMKCLNN